MKIALDKVHYVCYNEIMKDKLNQKGGENNNMNDFKLLHDRLTFLRDYAFDNGANTGNFTDYGKVKFYDNGNNDPYWSFEFEGIQVSFYMDHISGIKTDRISAWGRELYRWLDDVQEHMIQAIDNENERKQLEIQEESGQESAAGII